MRTAGIWLIALFIAIIGLGIILELDQLTATLRLIETGYFD